MTRINTEMRSLPFIKQAIEKLGIPYAEQTKVPYYFGQPMDADIVFGAGTHRDHNSGLPYACGIRHELTPHANEDGFEFITDYWGMDCSVEGKAILDKLGCKRGNPDDPNSDHWKWEGGGHVGVSGPLKLQQAYIGEVVEYASTYQGRSLTVIPLANGDIRHEQRGGDLGAQVVVVTARADGTCVIHVEDGDGVSCTAVTKFLEDVLGTVAQRDMLPEHERAGVGAGQRAWA
jgi:hypothetical protein